MTPRKVIVLHGHIPATASEDEKDVLVEVRHVSKTLETLGFTVKKIPATLNLNRLKAQITDASPDLVFNLVESLNNSSRFLSAVPYLLEQLQIPFTGSGADALHITTHKLLSKNIMKSLRIPTPAWLSCEEALHKKIAFKPPYIVKSIWEHASIGLSEKSIHHSKTTLLNAIRKMRLSQRRNFFVEQFIDGREFNLSLLETNGDVQVLPAAEICFDGFKDRPRIVDYKAKWDVDSFEYHHTNRCFPFLTEKSRLKSQIERLALACAQAFNIRGYARVDFRVDHSGKPFVLEVNANPCISPDSGFVAACKEKGYPYPLIIRHIVSAVNS